MTQPRQAQLDLLLSISEGLSRGSYEMLRVSPTDAMHAPSCGLAIRDAVEELRWMRADNERLTRERDEARYFLKIFVHAHASNNAVPPHLEEQARKALEGKP